MKTVKAVVLTKTDLDKSGNIKTEDLRRIFEAELAIYTTPKGNVIIKNRFGPIDVKAAMQLV